VEKDYFEPVKKPPSMKKAFILFAFSLFLFPVEIFSQIMPSPDRKEGEGPYDKLIIRGVTLIDGTGSPPIGPVDIVVAKKQDH
jgi:hypothetical protein